MNDSIKAVQEEGVRQNCPDEMECCSLSDPVKEVCSVELDYAPGKKRWDR